MGSIMALQFKDVPDELVAKRKMNVDGLELELSAAAFYDIFDSNEKLQDFVRQLACGVFPDPETAAKDIMAAMGFA